MENNKLKEAMEAKKTLDIEKYLVDNNIPFMYLYDTKVYLVDANNLPKNLELGSEVRASINFKKSKPSLEEAIEVLCNALREDTSEGSYYYSWQANIAMAFFDEYCRNDKTITGEEATFRIHEISNQAAKNF